LKKAHLHFMGIGGQGISAVAQMARIAGDTVTGCDRQESATTRALEQVGIPVRIGHSADHLQDVDTLVISPAVPALDAQNPELLAAQHNGIRVVTWQEILGELMLHKCVISVSGVHGKGTTTAMLSLLLVDADLDPTCEIGAVVPRFGTNYRLGASQYFVNEADEFNHNFWHYHPRVVVVTAIEFEHPEFYADYESFLAAFEHFIRGMDMQGDWSLPPTLILNADSLGCLELLRRLSGWPGQIVLYKTSDGQQLPDLQGLMTIAAHDIKLDGQTSFRVSTSGPVVAFSPDIEIQLALPGLHNIQNALAALTVAHIMGVDGATIAKTLSGFSGIRRRFEIRHQGPLNLVEALDEVVLIDDYAHHPTAIAATLEAARRRYPQQRLIAVYQPHMYSRTKTFFEQFLSAFDAADIVFITDIFPARERDTGLVHSRDLVEAMQRRPRFSEGPAQASYAGSVQNTTRLLTNALRSGDIVLIMGAGDVYRVTEQLLRDSVPTAETRNVHDIRA
jgi:UDP-N-acetylmuramate--alanine ligase